MCKVRPVGLRHKWVFCILFGIRPQQTEWSCNARTRTGQDKSGSVPLRGMNGCSSYFIDIRPQQTESSCNDRTRTGQDKSGTPTPTRSPSPSPSPTPTPTRTSYPIPTPTQLHTHTHTPRTGWRGTCPITTEREPSQLWPYHRIFRGLCNSTIWTPNTTAWCSGVAASDQAARVP
jgi:hypothetical protein